MDCIVHGIAKSRSRLSDFHFTMELQSVQFSRSVMSDSLRHHESHADDTTLMVESEELKSLLMKVKELKKK